MNAEVLPSGYQRTAVLLVLSKQTLTVRVSTLWPQAPLTLTIHMSFKGRPKKDQSEDAVE